MGWGTLRRGVGDVKRRGGWRRVVVMKPRGWGERRGWVEALCNEASGVGRAMAMSRKQQQVTRSERGGRMSRDE
eukprot:748673-Hanusia_phi.AAC.1